MPTAIPSESRTTKQLFRLYRLDGGLVDPLSAALHGLDETKGLSQELTDVDLFTPGIIKPRHGHSTVLDSGIDIDSMFVFKSLRIGDKLILQGEENDTSFGVIRSHDLADLSDIQYIAGKIPFTNVFTNGYFNDDGDNSWVPDGNGGALSIDETAMEMLITGTGLAAGLGMTQTTTVPYVVGDPIFYRFKFKVTNPNCLGIHVYLSKSSGGGNYYTVTSIVPPIDDTWHELSGIFYVPMPDMTTPATFLSITIKFSYDNAILADGTEQYISEALLVRMSEYADLQGKTAEVITTYFDFNHRPITHFYTTSQTATPHTFLNFADSLLFANGVDESGRWDGSVTTYPLDFPKCNILAEYRNRAVAADIRNNPTLLKLCHTGDPTMWDPAEVGTNAAEIYVSPDDGEKITGVLNMGNNGLLITKESKLYGLFGYLRSNFTVELLDSNIGCLHQNSLQFISPHAYFINENGIYRFSNGTPPEHISLAFNRIFREAIVPTSIKSCVINRSYLVTFADTQGTKYMFVYNTEMEKWVQWTVDANHFGVINALVGGVGYNEYYFGDSDGVVWTNAPLSVVDVGGEVIVPVIKTIPLIGGVAEVAKDFGDAYLFTVCTGVEYSLEVTMYIDGVRLAPPKVIEIPATPIGTYVTRLNIHYSGRALEFRIRLLPIATNSPHDLALTGLTYIAIPKDVL